MVLYNRMDTCNDSCDDMTVVQDKYTDTILCKIVEYMTTEDEDSDGSWMNVNIAQKDIYSETYIYYNHTTDKYHISGKILGCHAYSWYSSSKKTVVHFIRSIITYRSRIQMYTEKIYADETRANTYEYLNSITEKNKYPVSEWYNYSFHKKHIKKILLFIKDFQIN